ncbi:MAG: hypothetical protein RBG13Loki_2393 [Promethearchaeota archaeon CR_4]|nr:MAG: hypothetical protein RBG13Loki_2393 [Candidatus Lokiarchaeota archaeon CR_4]
MEIFLEENSDTSSSNPVSNWDVCFVKGRGSIVQAQAFRMEQMGVPTHNCAYAIHVTNYRSLYSMLAKSMNIPQPEFAVGYEKDITFEEYVVKEECVESTKKFIPLIGQRGKHVTNNDIYYFQRRIHSQWEYKIYSFGEMFFFFKEKPTLENPDKMATRVSIPENPYLRECVEKIKQVTKLTITSVDFLEEGKQFYLTDVNSAPNFNYIKNGPEILAGWLVNQIKS